MALPLVAATVAAATLPATPPRWNAAAGVWEANRATGDLELPTPLYIFGYGSLCWKSEFKYSESFIGRVSGWTRYFAQRSTDHRGTPGQPGLVCTLVSDAELGELGLGDAAAAAGSTCAGMCYRVADEDADEVLRNLDFREKGGYTLTVVEVMPAGDAAAAAVRALLYVANPENPNFSAAAIADVAGTARTIRTAVGPSGPNRAYLVNLAEWLAKVGEADAHVESLVASLACLDAEERPQVEAEEFDLEQEAGELELDAMYAELVAAGNAVAANDGDSYDDEPEGYLR